VSFLLSHDCSFSSAATSTFHSSTGGDEETQDFIDFDFVPSFEFYQYQEKERIKKLYFLSDFTFF